jgi:hypothetical protein
MDHNKCSRENISKAIQRRPVIQALQLTAVFVYGCHMALKTASHILCECVALAKFRLIFLGKHFYETKRL